MYILDADIDGSWNYDACDGLRCVFFFLNLFLQFISFVGPIMRVMVFGVSFFSF